jgi:CheY-like chemotaxis protein
MSRKTVLLVDDSRVARMMTRAVIEKEFPGWIVHEAATGEEALEAADASPPDFILMDVNMPGMGGMESARLFRARHPAIPLSLLTANIQDSIHEEAALLGVGYISKPLKEELLIRFLTGGDGPS